MSADRRDSIFCLVHLVEFMRCPCPERRRTDSVGQVLVCVTCGRHCSECACENPELEVRAAV